jgi:hypothetical protein
LRWEDKESLSARHNIALYLFRESVCVTLTDIGCCLLDIHLGKTQRTKAFCSHQIGRLDRLADLILDARADQLNCVSAIIASHQQSGLWKFLLRQFHYMHSGLRVIDADHDRIRLTRPGVAQGVEPGAIAEEDLESISSRVADPVGVPIDYRKVDPLDSRS